MENKDIVILIMEWATDIIDFLSFKLVRDGFQVIMETNGKVTMVIMYDLTLNVHIHRIRKKIGKDHIKTIKRVCYKYEE